MKAILLLLLTFNVFASEWESVEVPGAKCGDGKPYNVFIHKGKEQKMLIEFMGGGVCWDHKSCFQKISFFPWLHQYPVINSYSVFTSNVSKINPFKDFSKIYFPYCTADVHSGDHVSKYKNRTVYHYGKKNIELTFEYLKENHLVNFHEVNNLVVYGASAGAIASLVHGKFIESFMESNIKKTMIVDSPGLHFGKTFWNKFDEDMKYDFKQTFGKVELDVDFNDGAISKKMGSVFNLYTGWNVGIIMGLEDIVMSKSFGDITPKEEKELILSTDGVPYIAESYPNIHVWLKDTQMHTFLLSRYSALMKGENGKTVIDFVNTVFQDLPKN